jgi:Protein of unknown function (DUF3833)
VTTFIALFSGAALGIAAMLILLVLRQRLASFRAQRPEDYADAGPAFDLTRYLSGPLVLEGVIHGPTGRVTSRFTADAYGHWQGNSGTLREVFRYDTGREQSREWQLTVTPEGRIEGTAQDVVGLARGQAAGSAVVMHYRFRLPAESGGHVLNVTDWMYLAPNGTIMNRSQFTKAGIMVAELVATIRTAPQQTARQMAAE